MKEVEVPITMDLTKVLAQLRKERDDINATISNLERLEHGGRRSPGRPPSVAAKGSTNGANHGSRLPDLTAGEG